MAGGRVVGGWAAAGALLVTSAAQAATPTGGDLQRFSPEPAPLGGFSAGSAEVLDHLHYAVGLKLNFSSNPLVLMSQGQQVGAVVGSNTTLHVTGAVGLFGRVELGFGLPVVLAQSGNADAYPLPGSLLGDLRLQPRINLLSQWRHGFALAFSPTFTLPTGNALALVGDGKATFDPELDGSWRSKNVFAMANVAYRARPLGQPMKNVATGREVQVRAGAGLSLSEMIDAMVEVNGGFPVMSAEETFQRRSPVEFIGGLRTRVADQWAIDLAVGTGVVSGIGSPGARVVAGVTYGNGITQPEIAACVREEKSGKHDVRRSGKDTDGDGIDDACDLCPAQAETVNGIADGDGCAEPDSDQDGIIDAEDQCIYVAGVAPSGCPDQDKDGVLDKQDQCPAEPAKTPSGCPDSDKDGVPNKDDQCVEDAGPAPSGCPDTDNDGVLDHEDECKDVPGNSASGCPDKDDDGVIDSADQCIDEKGVAPTGCPDKDGDGVIDAKDQCLDVMGVAPTGCPDKDGDGVIDGKDQCLEVAGLAPTGCPDTDNDGVLDRDDKCPDQAETINGVKDEDGCADAGKVNVTVQGDHLEVLGRLAFEKGKDALDKASGALLKQVALTLKAHQELAKVRVVVHSGEGKVAEANAQLAKARAEAVVKLLVAEGVDAARLTAEGAATEPAADKKKAPTTERLEFFLGG